jgi:hypothetical protein
MNILHLSDLHFGTMENANTWYSQLADDLCGDLNCSKLDGLILSGDITNRSIPREYAAAEKFLEELRREFQLQPEQIVVVPGNHDVNWALAKKAYTLKRREEYTGPVNKEQKPDENHAIGKGEFVEALNKTKYLQRFEYFSEFYERIKGSPYPAAYEQQAILHYFKENNLLVLGLNTAWQLDHHYTSRASINPVALSNALTEIRKSAVYKQCLRVAVWHHPLSSPEESRIKDSSFLQRLAQAGFSLILHGHIHQADTSLYRYDRSPGGRKLEIISAGTFGALTREWVPGYPLQYNLLRLEENRLVVETRRRQEINGAWKPDAIWTQGPGVDPLPRFEIFLPHSKKHAQAPVHSPSPTSEPAPGGQTNKPQPVESVQLEPNERNDVVLLIGAGVSSYLGLPSLDDLLQQAIIGDDDVGHRIRNTRNAIEAYTRHSKAVFEELISQLRYYLEVSEMLRKDNTFISELEGHLPQSIEYGNVQRKWHDALTRCYRILLQEYGPLKINPKSPEFHTVLNLIGELAKINSGKLHIYTTNYDCSFQVMASNCLDLLFYSHIHNVKGHFSEDWHRAPRTTPDVGQPRVYVHRFHGCVGWFSDPRKPYGLEEVFGSGENLEINDDDKLHGMQIKLTSSQAIGTNPAFALAFEEFSEHLKQGKILLIWGYSFRDIEVMRYINQAFGQKTIKSILYIDPYLKESAALQAIKWTMGDAPVVLDNKFKPRRIDWNPTDGHASLIAKVVDSVLKTL